MEPTLTLNPHIEVTILDERVRAWGLPRYQSEMAAAIDLHACIDATLHLAAHSPAELIPAGIALHMGEPGMAALIVPRSGLGHRHGLVVGNLVGVIDADYTGPILVSAWNRNCPGHAPHRHPARRPHRADDLRAHPAPGLHRGGRLYPKHRTGSRRLWLHRLTQA